RVPGDNVGHDPAVAQFSPRGQAVDALAAGRELRTVGELKGAADAAVGPRLQAVGARLAAQVDGQDAVDGRHLVNLGEHGDRVDLLDGHHRDGEVVFDPAVEIRVAQREGRHRDAVVQALVSVRDRAGLDQVQM